MNLTLSQLGQIALTVNDVDLAESFYSEKLKLRKLFRFGNLLFYDCAGVRLLVEKSSKLPFKPESSILYFRVPDIVLFTNELKSRGVKFADEPHLVAPMEDHDLWMAFFEDPAGNILAIMQEAPKGYQPIL
jgi:methylmalonyl-CoA/ethylmalonyl-CoA epimerase